MVALFYSTIDDVWEVEGTPEESTDKETGIVECKVKLRVPWANRYIVQADLFTPEETPTVPPTLLGVGKSWPYHTNISSNVPPIPHVIHSFPAKVVSVDIINEGCQSVDGRLTEPDQFHIYEQSILDVRYSNSYAIDGIQETFQPTAEFIKFDHIQYKWILDDQTLSEGEAPGFLVKGSTFTIKTDKLHVDFIKPAFKDLVGSCNGGQFTLTSNIWGGTFFFNPEELLYGQPVTEVVCADASVNPKGYYMTTTAKLVYKPGGWNKYWRPKQDAYDQFYKIGDPAKEPVINYPLKTWTDPLAGNAIFKWLEGNGNLSALYTPPP